MPTSVPGGSGREGDGHGLLRPSRQRLCPLSPAPLPLSPVPFPVGAGVWLHPPPLCLCDKLRKRTHSQRQSCCGRARVDVTRGAGSLCLASPPLRGRALSGPQGQLLFVHSFPYLLCAQNVEVYTGTRFIYVFASALITPLTSSSPRPSPSAALRAGPGSRSARGTSGLPRTVFLTPSPGPSCQTRPPGCGARP